MTLTTSATPFHGMFLVTLLAASGWITHLSPKLPAWVLAPITLYQRTVPERIARALEPVPQVVQAPQALPAPVKEETTAERRARFAPFVAAAARAAKVEIALIEAVITAESAFNPGAVSKAGAVGLMQLMPETAEKYGVDDRWDPAQNILGGTRLLKNLLVKYDNNRELALAAYNAGEKNVEKARNRIPPFPETQKYVPLVLAYYQRYRRA